MADDFDTGEGVQDSSQKHQQANLTQALWIFFSEMKTAIVLLLLLAVVSILGTLIRQNASPEEYLAIYGAKKYGLIKSLGFTSVYSSSIYKLLLALVGINLSVCSINRFGATWRRTFHQKVCVGASRIGSMQRTETFKCKGNIEDVAGRVASAMRDRSYRVVKSSQADGVEMLASKGKLSLWGPYLTHVSILIIFFGAILGNILGFGGYTAINEGSSTSKYYRDSTQSEANLGFRVALRKFEIGHDIRHNPTAYRSDLVVYEGNNIVAQKVIDVNHPLTYKGVSFFQSDYGLAGLIVKITSPSGETQRLGFDLGAQSGPHGRTYAVTGEPFKEISVGGKTLTVFVHNFLPDYSGKPDTTTSFLPINPAAKIMVNDRLPEYKGLDAWSNLNWLEVGKSAKYKGFTVTLEDVVDYTGLQVSRNPGLPIIYIGFGLLLLGVFLSFYVVHKIVRLRIAADGGDVTVLMGASSREEPTVFDADFQRLRDNYRGDQS